MFVQIEQQIQLLSKFVPLEIFVVLGGLLEEIIAPIPSPLIMTIAGAMVNSSNRGVWFLVFISLLAAVGKTMGSWLIYFVSDKSEDIVLNKWGKLFGVQHKDVEKIGMRFNNTWKDDLLLVLLRAIPLIPGAPVAVVCGVIKLPIKTYLRSTFIGTFLRSALFGTIGYVGLSSHQEILIMINSLEMVGKVVVIAAIMVVVIWLMILKRNNAVQAWIHEKVDQFTS